MINFLYANEVIEHSSGKFFISYNPHLIGIYGEKKPETAFVIRDRKEKGKHQYLILYGDWREEFQKCETIEEGENVWLRNQEHVAFWSDDIDV